MKQEREAEVTKCRVRLASGAERRLACVGNAFVENEKWLRENEGSEEELILREEEED